MLSIWLFYYYLFQRLGVKDGEVIEVIIKNVENNEFVAEIKPGVVALIPNSHLSYDLVSLTWKFSPISSFALIGKIFIMRIFCPVLMITIEDMTTFNALAKIFVIQRYLELAKFLSSENFHVYGDCLLHGLKMMLAQAIIQ